MNRALPKYKVLLLDRAGRAVDLETDISYWRDHVPEYLGIGLDVQYTIQSCNIPFKLKAKQKISADGSEKTVWTVDAVDLAPRIREIVPADTYDEVIFMFSADQADNESWGDIVDLDIRSNCPYTMVWSKTSLVTLEYQNRAWRAINHERHHAIERRAWNMGINIHDQMDKTLVEGVWEDYYLDSSLYSQEGNRAVTLRLFSPFWAIMFKQPMQYKYFRPEEVVNMDEGFVTKLDNARGLAGIPFVITAKGGYRDEQTNEDVGGVKDSAHTKGLAADLRCRDSRERAIIVRSLFAVGINRVVVYTKSKHVHCDVDMSKPTPVLTILDK